MSINVSIAMATFNGAKYIEEQLSSIKNQTRPPDEIVLCDDGSTDNTLNVVNRFSSSVSIPVRIFVNNKKLGYSQNFSKALSLCSGDYVFLADQDDVWFENKIENTLEFFRLAPDKQLLIHDVEYCKEDLTRIGQTKIQRMESSHDLESQYVTGMATAIRGSFLRLCLPVPDLPGLAYDNWLHACSSTIGVKMVLREVLSLYRRHEASATAVGKLNVDFVTSQHFYKKKRRFLPYVLRMVMGSPEFGDVDISPVVRWLQTNEVALVEGGYAAEQVVRGIIEEEEMRVKCVVERKEILSCPRVKRGLRIIQFYRGGGYNRFLGWKSAIKDFFYVLPRE